MRLLTWSLTLALTLTLAAPVLAAPAAASSPPTWRPLGPWGGDVTALAIDPRDPRVLWAGTRYGGVYLSRDQGESWAPRSAGLRATWIVAIALDPFNPDRLWVATLAGGLYRSRDAGATWRFLNSGLPGWQVDTDLLADPTRRGRLYVRTEGTVFRTEDGGASWERVRRNATAVAVDAAGALYLAIGDAIVRSTDGGRSFRRRNPKPTGMTIITGLVVHPRRLGDLWASSRSNVWRSVDGGATWALRGRPTTAHVSRLLPHPELRGVLYALAGSRLWKSVDVGTTWRELRPEPSGRAVVAAAAVDPRVPANLVIGLWAFGQPGGAVLSATGGESFRWISRGIAALPTATFAVDPRDTRRIAAAVTSVGILLSEDGGEAWTHVLGAFVPGIAPYATDVAFDPLVAGRVYAIDINGVARSDDGGASWPHLPQPPNSCNCSWLEPDPAIVDRVYRGGFGGLERSDDAGATWTTLQGPGVPSLIFGADAMLIDPADPDHLFVQGFVLAGGPRFPSLKPRLIESRDGGATWVRIDETLPTHPSVLAADPVDFDRPWVTTALGIYRADGGGGWTLVSAALALGRLQVGAEGLLVGIGYPVGVTFVSQSVWLSGDGGSHWLDLRTDLPFPPFDLERVTDATGDRIVVLAGGGLYSRALP